MSEQKRATLLTISTQKGDVKKVKEKSKTIRFCLTLPESNEKSCPEYNYKDLLNSAEKKNKGKVKNHGHENGLNPGLNHLDPFDDDDEDVIRISKQFEEKYGGVPKKKRRGKNDDYVDIGAGYDESDSFIDNTDAYDEMVPADITTVHGGFYINSGALEFKQVEFSGSEDSSDSNHSANNNITTTSTTSRKRIIEDTDESESEEEKEEVKSEQHVEKKAKIETNGVVHKAVVKKKLIIVDDNKESKEMKKRKIDENLLKKKAITVKDLLREKREELDVTLEIDTSCLKENKPSGSSSTINDAIESVINAVRGKNVDENSKESTSSSDVAVVSTATTESESSRDPMDPIVKQDLDIPLVKLPDDLPPHILDIIGNIKKAAENSCEGKVKFFTPPVNNMLLSLEINSRKLMKLTRVGIYEHLAPFVKCKQNTLMRRAKNLLLEHEQNKYKDSMQRLKAIIDGLMPIVKRSYERECQKVRDEMFLASANANANANTNAENSDTNNCKVKRTPRKKFPWSEETRKIFQDIVTVKKKCYPLEGHRKEPFETHLEQFLKNEMLPLWPEGWMSIAALNKQAKLISENNVNQKMMMKTAKIMKPISLDISATFSPVMPFHSPVRKSPSCPGASGITVIPISMPVSVSVSSSKTSLFNGPKVKQQQQQQQQQHSPSDLSVTTINKKTSDCNNSSVLNLSSVEVHPKDSNQTLNVAPSLLLNNINNNNNNNNNNSISSNVTITNVDVRTSNSNSHSHKKDTKQEEELNNSVEKSVISKPTNLKQRILENINKQTPVIPTVIPTVLPTSTPSKNNDSNDDCQIIDLTESPSSLHRKPGPKSKTRNLDGSVKVKQHRPIKDTQRPLEKKEGTISVRKTEELTGTQALNQLITGLTKYGTSEQQTFPKETPNEDDMEQVMKDLKELQQMQEHARHDLDVMSPSSSPVSVIAYNSSYSPSKIQADDLSKARRQSADGTGGFQDIFQKHLYQDPPLFKPSQTSGLGVVYNSQQKNNYNNSNINNFPGTISNSMNNIRYSQSSSKYPTSLTHLSANTAGATNHTDDFALFQNFLYQYGFHNSTGSKQKSPP